MAIILEQNVIDLLKDNATDKVLATTDKDGVPHVVFKGSIETDAQGNIIYLELLESSKTNSNLVNSIWFKKKVAVTVKSETGTSVQIKGIPIRAIITGPLFEYYYKLVRQKLGDVDLSTVWVIAPEEIRVETFNVRKEDEERNHPLLVHLDRLAK
jgi:hypothetical protein